MINPEIIMPLSRKTLTGFLAICGCAFNKYIYPIIKYNAIGIVKTEEYWYHSGCSISNKLNGKWP